VDIDGRGYNEGTQTGVNIVHHHYAL